MKTIFKNGNVIDGTGSEGRIADVMVDEGRIVAIGQIEQVLMNRLLMRQEKLFALALSIPIHTLICQPLLIPRCRRKFVRVLLRNCWGRMASP
jgi:dihydroorotase-like cyclic amidohydrolase